MYRGSSSRTRLTCQPVPATISCISCVTRRDSRTTGSRSAGSRPGSAPGPACVRVAVAPVVGQVIGQLRSGTDRASRRGSAHRRTSSCESSKHRFALARADPNSPKLLPNITIESKSRAVSIFVERHYARVLHTASLAHLDRHRRDVDRDDVEAFVLQVRRTRPAAGADVQNASAREADRRASRSASHWHTARSR